jgi:ATP-dependent exoDNAse (exonuclease V) beta subunit
MVGERSETGYIDLLFKNTSGWQIVDFKTDIIRSDAIRAELVNQYRFQMLRYEKAVETLLGQKPGVRICFLDDNGSANIIPMN